MNWSQLRTVLWLRWRLTRNQWSRAGQLSAIIMSIATVIGLVMGVAAGIAGVVGGAVFLKNGSPTVLLLLWDALIGIFLFLWFLGVLTEIQRPESIDLGKLLHLPISLRGVFFFNYLASHLTLSMVLFVPAAAGLCVGLAWSKGPLMILLGLSVAGFVFMVTAWTYCLRGWLISLMTNQRRRRTIIATVTVVFVLIAQLPNLYINLLQNPDRKSKTRTRQVAPRTQGQARQEPTLPDVVLRAHTYVPFLWPAKGAMALAEGHAWPAVLGAFGGFFLGTLGLARAYRSTVRFYHGGQTAKPPKRLSQATPVKTRARNWLEARLPWVPEETSTLAIAFFRSLTRAPELRMALLMNFVMLFIIGLSFFSRGITAPPEMFKPLMAVGAIAFQFLGFMQPMFNQFGFDRDGFRSLVLLPVNRRHILFAKNLAFLPICLGGGVLFLVLVSILAKLSPLVVLAAVLQLVTAFLLVSMLGNALSTLFPYRIAAGGLKPTKVPATTTLMIFVSHLFFPLVMIPVFIPPLAGMLTEQLGWIPGVVINLLLSLVLAGLACCIYWICLPGLGNLLQRREKQILQVVTTEVE